MNTFGPTGLLSRIVSSTVYYLFDPQGSVASRLNGSQTVLSSDQYDAHGNQWQGNTTDVFAYGAQWGYYRDTETGLYLCTVRHYDPRDGRFITRDPIDYDGGVNLYGYVANNPVGGADPAGTFTFITGAVGAVAGGVIGGAVAAFQGCDLRGILAGAGKGALIGGIAGLTGGAVGGVVAGWAGGGVAGGVLGGAAGSAVGDIAVQETQVSLGWRDEYDPWQTAQSAALGALAGGFVWRPTNAFMQKVTRWGGPGAWYLVGGPSRLNWLLSGIFRRYPFRSCTTTTVPGAALRYPPGLESFKGLFGQRVYPPLGPGRI